MAAFILAATTGFYAVCLAMQKIGVPNVFVVQLLFLYRYGFVLIDEGARMVRAWQLRAPVSRMMNLRTFCALAGNLFLRTNDRSQRIYQAMCCRGFDGRIRIVRQLRWTRQDTIFLAGCCVLFLLLRFAAPAATLGRLIVGQFL
jgi:cobalt/nickel transport system permease protein